MRSRFLVLLLLSLLPSLLLRCGAPTQPPAPTPIPVQAPTPPAPVQTPPPAPPPVEDKVEVTFDRFTNRTTVRFPSVQQTVTRAKRQLTPAWLVIFEGQTLPPTPRPLQLTFWKMNKTWEYLRCHSLAMLADGSPVQLRPAEHDGDIGRSYVMEHISVLVSLATARTLAESHLVEFQVCNTEGRFSEGDLQGLRDVIKVLTPQ